MEYHVLKDGWIKVPAADFQIHEKASPLSRLMIGLNQLLIRTSGKNVLIDTGLGNKWSQGEISLLDFERPRKLITELSKYGYSPGDIDIVILSHLHYDHSGGGTEIEANGQIHPVFKNANYIVQEVEYNYARNPLPDHSTDYINTDWEPLLKTGQLTLINGESWILPDVHVFPAPGHCPGHQVVVIETGLNTLFYPGDLFSTPEHANLVITTSFDYDKEELLKNRKKWLKILENDNWDCFYCHKIREPISKLVPIA